MASIGNFLNEVGMWEEWRVYEESAVAETKDLSPFGNDPGTVRQGRLFTSAGDIDGIADAGFYYVEAGAGNTPSANACTLTVVSYDVGTFVTSTQSAVDVVTGTSYARATVDSGVTWTAWA